MSLKEKLINKLLFCPEKDFEKTPPDYQLEYEDVVIDISDKRSIHGWFVKGSSDTTVIYMHGTKGNIGTYLNGVFKLNQLGFNVFIFDYEGFGKSKGMPTVKNTIHNSITSYNYIANKVSAENICLFGYSYGGAVAVEVASKNKVKSIVVEASFSSLNEVANEHYPLLGRMIVPSEILNTSTLIKEIDVPILISYAELDKVVKNKHAFKLFDNAKEPKKLFKIKNAEHHNICERLGDDYKELIKEMFN